MALYLVVSETLWETVPVLDYGEGPREPYAIVDLVCAESREQARYLAWQKDKNSTGDFRDCPNFRTRKLADHPDAKGIVSDWDNYQSFWDHPKAIALLNSSSRDNF